MKSGWRLSHARGYLGLGLLEEAAAELAALPADEADSLEALSLRALVLQAQQQWILLQPVAAALVGRQPEEAGWWITWAYATRRVDSLASAEAILRDAEIRHPDEPAIQFNLGCYACQRGDLAEARRRVDRAVALDASFRQQAATDDDLAPLRTTGYTPGKG
jgi:tetratricopeptide (TPR) repeat protein